MKEIDFGRRDSSKIQQATLCFLVRQQKGGEQEVLLAMKKRGFGKGLWNGAGGKKNSGENISEAAIRETKEEIGVKPKTLEKVALLHFYFPDDPKKLEWNQDVHVFMVDEWSGKPTESEEMRPEWFSFDIVPFEVMWDVDNKWLPKVLDGEKIECWIAFDNNNKGIGYKIEPYVEGR